jgi:hypothetical protein
MEPFRALQGGTQLLKPDESLAQEIVTHSLARASHRITVSSQHQAKKT